MSHILFLTQWFPSEQAPIYGIFIREHARAVALFHRVTVLYVKGLAQEGNATYQIERQTDGALEIYRLNYTKPPIPKTSWLRKFGGAQQVVNRLIQENSRPDLIHANIYSTGGLAWLLSRRYHLPVVLTENASSFPRHLFTRTEALKTRFFLNQFQWILPVSDELRTHMQSYGIRGPYRIIPNTANTELFYPDLSGSSVSGPCQHLLVVARLDPLKGIHHLLQALQRVNQARPGFDLTIIGDGPQREELERLAGQLGLQEKVHFSGMQSKEEVARAMRRASFFILPSLRENLPVVVVEAMASGLPVISTRVGGIPEIVTPECGLLVEPGDVDQLVQAILNLMDHLDRYHPQEISRYAQARFSYQAVGRMYSQVYEEVLAEYQR